MKVLLPLTVMVASFVMVSAVLLKPVDDSQVTQTINQDQNAVQNANGGDGDHECGRKNTYVAEDTLLRLGAELTLLDDRVRDKSSIAEREYEESLLRLRLALVLGEYNIRERRDSEAGPAYTESDAEQTLDKIMKHCKHSPDTVERDTHSTLLSIRLELDLFAKRHSSDERWAEYCKHRSVTRYSAHQSIIKIYMDLRIYERRTYKASQSVRHREVWRTYLSIRVEIRLCIRLMRRYRRGSKTYTESEKIMLRLKVRLDVLEKKIRSKKCSKSHRVKYIEEFIVRIRITIRIYYRRWVRTHYYRSRRSSHSVDYYRMKKSLLELKLELSLLATEERCSHHRRTHHRCSCDKKRPDGMRDYDESSYKSFEDSLAKLKLDLGLLEKKQTSSGSTTDQTTTGATDTCHTTDTTKTTTSDLLGLKLELSLLQKLFKEHSTCSRCTATKDKPKVL